MGSGLTIASLIDRVRDEASDIIARHKKLSSFRLYAVLAPVMEVCERAERDPDEREQLNALFRDQPKEGNRRYIENGSDIYVLVCRYVFHSTPNTANLYRYAEALRQAAKMQVGSSELERWLRENGGVNALYFRRAILRKPARISILRLLEAVEFPRDKPFTLKLEWTDKNAFRVVEAVP